jgi:hypothetical protein
MIKKIQIKAEEMKMITERMLEYLITGEEVFQSTV